MSLDGTAGQPPCAAIDGFSLQAAVRVGAPSLPSHNDIWCTAMQGLKVNDC
jgi:hypothetical protein